MGLLGGRLPWWRGVLEHHATELGVRFPYRPHVMVEVGPALVGTRAFQHDPEDAAAEVAVVRAPPRSDPCPVRTLNLVGAPVDAGRQGIAGTPSLTAAGAGVEACG